MTDKARILFVDDEKRVLNAMRGLFRREYELFLAIDGAEAIRIASEHEIDVIVADQRMPGMTGIELLGKIKQQSPRTVRILLTGYADPSAVEGSINIGEVFRFLSKPCPPKMLRETLSLAIVAAQTKPVATNAPAAPATPNPPIVQQAPHMDTPQAAGQAKVAAPEADQIPPASTPAAAAAPAPLVQAAAATEPPVQSATLPALPAANDNDETEPALPILDKAALESSGEHTGSHWQTVTNVVMSEDTSEETQECVALTSSTLGVKDVAVVVFTVDSEFAATAIRAVSADRNTILATTLVKVAQAIVQQNAGILVTDFTTNSTILQKIIGALKKHMPELVTIVVTSGRDTTDMINLINYGQIFRYVLKPIEPEQLRSDINAAAIRHLYLLNSPESAMRHHVIDSPETADSSETINNFLGRIRNRKTL